MKKLPQRPILPKAIKPEKPETESQIVKLEAKSQFVKPETKSQKVKPETKSQNPDLEPPLLEPNYPDSAQSDSGKTFLNIDSIIHFYYYLLFFENKYLKFLWV